MRRSGTGTTGAVEVKIKVHLAESRVLGKALTSSMGGRQQSRR
jgi:hypothetical protein